MLKVYSASAGSGKTYNLVFDYLAACFRNHLPAFLKLDNRHDYTCPSCNGYQQILAITFTNNAGAEMKERVVRQLNRLAFATSVEDLDPNDFDNLCKKVFGTVPLSEEEMFIFVQRTSKALLHSILYDYARFSITTIDSFIQRVIRSSALYLHLSMNYAVQIRLTDFFQMAIDRYICELTQNDHQFQVVVNELIRQLEDKGSANINRFLTKGLRLLYNDAEKSHPYVKGFLDEAELLTVVKEWRETKYKLLAECQNEVRPLADKALQVIQAAKEEDILPNGTMKWDKWFSAIADDPFNLNHEDGFEASRFNKELKTSTIFTISSQLSRKEKADKEPLKEAFAGQVEAIFRQIQDIVLKNAKTFFSCHILDKNANNLLVLDALKNHVEAIKAQTDSFFLSESNPLLNDEIQSDSHGDPLFEKFNFYKKFFIDEFQDTSLMQWQDLKPLIIEALGTSTSGELTLFGDVKQSIYRFRNGDVNLFYRLTDKDRLQSTDSEKDIVRMLRGKEDFRFESLSTNYRSRTSVIEFNNHFFRYYAERLGKEGYYQDVEQQTNPKKVGGLVQYLGYNTKDFKDIRKVWPDCPDDFYQNVYPNFRAEEKELLYAVKDAKQRGYSYGEMAVLLSGRAKCNEFAQCLIRADIPVVTSESLQLCDNSNINLIISTLKLILNPSDTLAQSVILEYFSRMHSKDFNSLICNNHLGRFYSIMKETFGIQDFKKEMEHWMQNPFLITVKEIARFYHFDSDADPFLADFFDLVYDYTRTQNASVADFLVWWEDLNHYQESIPRLSLSGAADAVKLLTIHSSKGLEYKVVITHCTASNSHETYYWVTDPKSGQSCYVKHEKNMQFSDFQAEYTEEEDKRVLDAMNLWYVGFTRACDMLYILAENKETSKESSGGLNIKKGLKKFAEDSTCSIFKKEGLIQYYGDFGWQKPPKDSGKTKSKEEGTKESEKKEPEKDGEEGAGFRVSCSALTFLDNPNIKVVPTEERTEAQDTGTYIHRFLQKLTVFPSTAEEREKATSGEPEEIRIRLQQLFERTEQDSDLRPYFYLSEGDRVLNEVTVIKSDGEERRPDRIVMKPDHVMIIDYKTGQEYKKKYETQLAEYQQCLMAMGYQDVRTGILYID